MHEHTAHPGLAHAEPRNGPAALPINSDHTATVLRVMADHGVSQAQLSAATGLSPSTISRVCSGQYAITSPITQALWRLTADARLVQVALGVTDAVILDAGESSNHRPDVSAAACIIACSDVTRSLADSRDDEPMTVRVIDNALKHLLGVRRQLAGDTPVPFRHRRASTPAAPLTA